MPILESLRRFAGVNDWRQANLRALPDSQRDLLCELFTSLQQLGGYWSEQGDPRLLLMAAQLERSARALQQLLSAE